MIYLCNVHAFKSRFSWSDKKAETESWKKLKKAEKSWSFHDPKERRNLAEWDFLHNKDCWDLVQDRDSRIGLRFAVQTTFWRSNVTSTKCRSDKFFFKCPFFRMSLEYKFLFKIATNICCGLAACRSEQIFVAFGKSNFRWGPILTRKKNNPTKICFEPQIGFFCCRKDIYFYIYIRLWIHIYI